MSRVPRPPWPNVVRLALVDHMVDEWDCVGHIHHHDRHVYKRRDQCGHRLLLQAPQIDVFSIESGPTLIDVVEARES